MRTKRLGVILTELGLLTKEQLFEALELQKEDKERLGTILVRHKYITERQLIDALSMQLGVDYIDLTKTEISSEMSHFVPESLARKMDIVPVRIVKEQLYLAMADPLNFVAIEEVRKTSKKHVTPMIAAEPAVRHAIHVLYGAKDAAQAIAEIRTETAAIQENDAADPLEVQNGTAPVVRLINFVIERAVSENASDVHFEPTEEAMEVRIRVDGMLHRIMEIPFEFKDVVISRLKVMAKLDIVEKRIPQDGRAVFTADGKEVDMRLSTLPTIYGEKAALRILKRNGEMLNRRGIGIPEAEDGKLNRLLGLTSGVIMIVGPTGSGKSSTMYTMIRELLSEHTNLVTLEDPVEYHIPGAVQVQIQEKAGLTFASGLRAVLRQDPDIICIGEIRDGETAEIAMRAAMTGHLVITTVHTEDAISAVNRLRDMGVAPYLIAAGLKGVISQRLLRKICPVCRHKIMPEKKALMLAGMEEIEKTGCWSGNGCDHCFHSGYRGRTGVFEIMMVREKLRRCIMEGFDRAEFVKAACEDGGYVPMTEYAKRLVADGTTTVDEVIRTMTVL